VADPVQLTRSHGVYGVLARKQPGGWPADAPPLAQNIEQHRGKHRKAVLAPLALLDSEQHARAVDVRDLQRYHLGRPEPCAIGNAQRRFILGGGRRVEEAAGLILGQDRGQLRRLLDAERGLRRSYLSSVTQKKNLSAVIAEFTLAAPSGLSTRWRR
jgi:hypothetical protein